MNKTAFDTAGEEPATSIPRTEDENHDHTIKRKTRNRRRRGGDARPSAVAGPAQAADPVHITYGYHPYWTGGWNGVIIKAKDLWKKHLPAGSTVRFEPHLTGPPMINAMLADKMQIGTMGDMPSLVATTKKDIADIRLVSVPCSATGKTATRSLCARMPPISPMSTKR